MIEPIIFLHRLDGFRADAGPFRQKDLDRVADGVDQGEDDDAHAQYEGKREQQPAYDVSRYPQPDVPSYRGRQAFFMLAGMALPERFRRRKYAMPGGSLR
jgi:hypothetical protein